MKKEIEEYFLDLDNFLIYISSSNVTVAATDMNRLFLSTI